MQNLILCSLLSLFFISSYGQDCPHALETLTPFETSKFRTNISNDGSLFLENLQVRQNEEWISLSFVGGLWIGGLSPEGDLLLAAQTWGAYSGYRDFFAGPIKANTASVDNDYCIKYDKVWVVTKEEIEAHRQDFEADGIVNNPIERIFAWPAHQKLFSYFYQYNGFNFPKDNVDLAPFFDQNKNGFYEPHLGEYPIPLPENPQLIPDLMAWNVMNDIAGVHAQSNGSPLSVEVQQLHWSLACEQMPVLENTIFVEYKIINRSQAPIDSIYTGVFMDYDLGCFTDDYVGCTPSQNSFFAYNANAIDGDASLNNDCENNHNFGAHPPMQSLTFLNKNLHSLIGFYVSDVGLVLPHFQQASSGMEFYNYLAGRWRDGRPMYNDGILGYPSDDTSYEQTNFLFSGNPLNEEEWSMYSVGVGNVSFQPIGSIYQPRLEADETLTLRTAHIFHQDTSLFHLEKVDLMQENIGIVQDLYDDSFEGINCFLPVSVHTFLKDKIRLYPNPTSSYFQIEVPNDKTLQSIRIYDTLGQKVLEQEQVSNHSFFDIENWQSGIYHVQIEIDFNNFTYKLVKL